MPSNTQRPFLTAAWRWLVMMNYRVDPAALTPHLPPGTELDTFGDEHLVSMVGFLFEETRFLGRVPLPLHQSFEEVNLRFYVRRFVEGEARRGVVFIKELVPSRSVTFVARTLFNENYEYAPMRHRITWNDDARRELGGTFDFQWKSAGRWSELSGVTRGPLTPLAAGSMEEFITEHYWGYSLQPNGATLEYAVEHPRWNTWQVESSHFDADVAQLYGPEFTDPLTSKPHSALVAEGSAVSLYNGVRI